VVENTSTPLEALVNVDQPTIPGARTLASVRVIQTSPDTPVLDVKLNGTVFKGVTYKQTTNYQQIPAGTYHLEGIVNMNHTILTTTEEFVGGFAYSIFIEGYSSSLVADLHKDYVPPNTGRLRFLHASPNTSAVDLLVNGSADFRNTKYESGTPYQSYNEGKYTLRVVPTDKTLPTLVSAAVDIVTDTDHSFLLIGVEDAMVNHTHPLEPLLLTDNNTLPADGHISVRFIHASPNTGLLGLRANDVNLFANVTYGTATTYEVLNASIYTVGLLIPGVPDVAASVSVDMRVASGSAVYTLVAEGLVGQNLRIVAFRDNGASPPPDQGSSAAQSGIPPLVIGLIVAGVVLLVIIVGAVGVLLWKRHKRAGYTEIQQAATI